MLKQIKFLQFRKTKGAKKALIICYTRTGSTTLSHCFILHPDICLAEEVFNKRKTKFSSIVHSIDDFQKNVYDQYNLFQIKFSNLGARNFKELLSRKKYIILVLYRKDSFKRTLSALIAQELQRWGSVESIFERDPFELNSVLFQKRISNYKKELKSMKNVLDENKHPYRVIAYEDIFSPTVEINERMTIFMELLTYFGFEKEKILNKKQKLIELLSESRKINNLTSYSYVKNYNELYECFGNEIISWDEV